MTGWQLCHNRFFFITITWYQYYACTFQEVCPLLLEGIAGRKLHFSVMKGEYLGISLCYLSLIHLSKSKPVTVFIPTSFAWIIPVSALPFKMGMYWHRKGIILYAMWLSAVIYKGLCGKCFACWLSFWWECIGTFRICSNKACHIYPVYKILSQ